MEHINYTSYQVEWFHKEVLLHLQQQEKYQYKMLLKQVFKVIVALLCSHAQFLFIYDTIIIIKCIIH